MNRAEHGSNQPPTMGREADNERPHTFSVICSGDLRHRGEGSAKPLSVASIPGLIVAANRPRPEPRDLCTMTGDLTPPSPPSPASPEQPARLDSSRPGGPVLNPPAFGARDINLAQDGQCEAIAMMAAC